MSSFTYHKKYFIEAAGFCAGIAAEKKAGGEKVLRMYNYDAGRVFNDEDFYITFAALFEMNAASVARQYHDEEPERDPNEYRDIFIKAKQATRCAWIDYYCNGADTIKQLIFKFSDFCDGILYQIEDPDISLAAAFVINDIRAKMIPILCRFSRYDMNCDNVDGWSGLQIATK